MKILFVCLGNICRSPTAEGVFRRLLDDEAPELAVELDSAGTHAYHAGEPPDRRSQAAALNRGVDLSAQRSRVVVAEDFEAFDLILAMDESNLDELEQRCPPERRERLALLMPFAAELGLSALPDPYYGGASGFERVLDLVEAAARGLLDHVRANAPLRDGNAVSAENQAGDSPGTQTGYGGGDEPDAS